MALLVSIHVSPVITKQILKFNSYVGLIKLEESRL
jgi:hypothetical protein